MKKNIWFLLLSCFVFLNCEESVVLKNIDGVKELIQINSFISPMDELIKVRVSRTFSLFSELDPEEDFRIKDAVVTLSNENGDEVNLIYVDESFANQIPASEFLIVHGKRYFLKVLVDGKEFTASCKIPAQKVGAITTEFNQRFDGFSFQDNLKVTFEDLTGGNNFYILDGKFLNDDNQFVSDLFFDLERFVTDANGDGIIISSNTFVFRQNLAGIDKIKIRIANVEEILFQLNRLNYQEQENEGNPFLEPIVYPNNIQGDGGIGVFAGYQLTELDIVLPPE